MEAIQMGAISMLPMVGDIIVSAFTFVTLISWINSTTVWFGDRLGVHNLTIEVMASYVLYPVAYIMGIHPDDCRAVGMLMGYRIFTANFVAFLKMAELKGNKAAYDGYMLATNFTGGVEYTRDDVILSGLNVTLKNGFIRYERSEAIITYSLCGFSSVLAVAMTLGIMHSLVPNRRHWISTIAVPALVAGNVANCMTGCFAGIFF
ncbi:sodium/nucleoside cotransporter 1-like [Aplysia californica]|uniref:Sodium/nucleoside cotransporter 1-like n=1 Tax=Aplysia californica TaxID=6500 RepID=A0ABM1VW33_APLCA|nr:sodium/nucleoside cotransporter 1-like [Aplysia californica]